MGITSAALSAYRALIAAAFTYLATGSASTVFTISQTALGTEITATGLERASATVSAVTTIHASDTVRLVHTWTATGGVTVREVATFNASSAGTMGVRKVTDSAFVLEVDDEFTYALDTILAYQA